MRLGIRWFIALFVPVVGACELAYPTHEAPDDAGTPVDAGVVTNPCKPPGLYCGNDKVVGDPNVLYKCVADADAVVQAHCEAGCVVAPPGYDDYCVKP